MSRTYRHRHSAGQLGYAQKFVDGSVRSVERRFMEQVEDEILKIYPPSPGIKIRRWHGRRSIMDPYYNIRYYLEKALRKQLVAPVNCSYSAPHVRWYKISKSTVWYKKHYNRRDRRCGMRLTQRWAQEGDDFNKSFPPPYDFEWDLW